MRKNYLFSLLAGVVCFSISARAQFISITSHTAHYNEDFNTLSTSGTNQSALPNGWWINETTTAAATVNNLAYNAGDGSSNAGNTYSFGTGTNTDRAIGSVASGSNASNFGVRYINNSGMAFTSYTISFTMEQWRSGGNRTNFDSLYFFHAVNGGLDSSGFVRTGMPAWARKVAGDLTSKTLGGPTGAGLNGNDTAYQRWYTITITGDTVNAGDTLYLRWRDPNVVGNDDGLGIDSFSFVVDNSGGVTPPSSLTNIAMTGLTKNTAQVSYTKDVSYVDGTMSILVFAKKDTAIIAGTPTISNANYTASSDLMMPGTAYQHDANAICVYKGDATTFTLSGMETGSTYHLLTYVVTDADSLYSGGVVTSGTSLATTAPVTSLSFTSGGQTTAKLKWTKPAAYDNGTYTTVVFVKKDSSINGMPMAPFATSYSASADFSSSFSQLETDSLATCVFNGDADSVWVTGLTFGTTYFASVFVFREVDSVYSAATSAFVETDGLIPLPSPATNLVVANNGYSALDLSWTKDLSYVDATYTTLVFAKAITAITTGTNTTPIADYIDSLNFGKGSLYQHDSMAFCIYKGDANSITTTGLMDLTQYHFNIYVVRESDTVYSTALVGNATTLQAPPAPVSGLTAVALSQTSARLSWVKNPSYQNSTTTTLVFVKAGTINAGTINKGVSGYTASTFLGNGTPFDADPLAYCVFKADTNFVTVTGLLSQTNYEFEVFTMRDFDSTESLGAKASFVSQGPPPVYTIGAINKVNTTTGVADSNGVKAIVRGVVYGGNQRATGLQFVMRDATGGITAFITSKNFGYTVTEGDSVEIQGIVTTFRGLVEMGTLDTVILLGSGKTLKAPTVVVKVEEPSENDLIRVNTVKFITTPSGGVWPSASTNISVTNANGDTIVVRVLSTFAIAGQPLPTTPTFDIIGLGVQFSTSATAPYPFNGYQIFPRTQNDIIEIPVVVVDSLSPFDLLTPSNNDTIDITNANLGDSITISWSASVNSNGTSATEYILYLDTVGGDFGSPIVEEEVGPLTLVKLTKEDIVIGVLEPAGVVYGGIYAGQWMVEAMSDNLVRASNQTFTVYFRNSITTGLANVSSGVDFRLYPNPTTHYTTISGIAQNDVVTVMDITGKIIVEQTSSSSEFTISTADYRSGLYFVKVQSGDKVAIKKLLVN